MNKFDIYFNELIEWNNTKHKLTGHTDRQSADDRLFNDATISFEDFDLSNKSLLDVGAGAGFPSVPLLINDETIKLTIVESMKKRTDFLEHLKSKLGINFEILNIRAEDFDRRESFDFVTARAVARLNILLELTTPFLKVGGTAIFVKGPNVQEELDECKNTFKQLNLELVKVINKKMPGGFENNIIVCKKIKETDKKYPRVFTLIKSKPL